MASTAVVVNGVGLKGYHARTALQLACLGTQHVRGTWMHVHDGTNVCTEVCVCAHSVNKEKTNLAKGNIEEVANATQW